MKVNVSEVSSFMQCRFRWWCEYVMNRVPIATAPALDGGRLLHRIFERHFTQRITLLEAAIDEMEAYRRLMLDAPAAALPNAEKALRIIEDLAEALPLWEDKFQYDAVLEVEEAHEYPDPMLPGLIWQMTPDRVLLVGGDIVHEQNRGLAPGMNFATYKRLQNRSYHEHLYLEALAAKHRRKVRGTVFNLVRKLKFRTNVGKRNEETKTANEMFWQGLLPVDLEGGLHRSVMMSLRQHAVDIIRAREMWERDSFIPAPNEKMNGGYSGNSEDPYFRVLMGEIRLEDDTYFKPRESRYSATDAA